MTPATLTVSIVTYRPDLALLERTLRTLAASLVAARKQELMRAANVVLIDNTGTRAERRGGRPPRAETSSATPT